MAGHYAWIAGFSRLGLVRSSSGSRSVKLACAAGADVSGCWSDHAMLSGGSRLLPSADELHQHLRTTYDHRQSGWTTHLHPAVATRGWDLRGEDGRAGSPRAGNSGRRRRPPSSWGGSIIFSITRPAHHAESRSSSVAPCAARWWRSSAAALMWLRSGAGRPQLGLRRSTVSQMMRPDQPLKEGFERSDVFANPIEVIIMCRSVPSSQNGGQCSSLPRLRIVIAPCFGNQSSRPLLGEWKSHSGVLSYRSPASPIL